MSRQDMSTLAWPRYPSKSATMLALVGGIALAVGVGILLQQRWLSVVGYVLAAALVIYHLYTHILVRRERKATLDASAATLVSHCKQLGGSPLLQQYFGTRDDVVLMLTDDALYLFGDSDPLDLFTSIPLYEIHSAAHPDNNANGLELIIESSHQRSFPLRFNHFEPSAPARAWVDALKRHPMAQMQSLVM